MICNLVSWRSLWQGNAITIDEKLERMWRGWGFARQGPYYPWINHEKKTMEKWVMYCVPCGVERSINPSFNLLNWKTHLSPTTSGFDNVHEKNLKLYQNKEINAIKEVRKNQEKVEATMKRSEDWVFKYDAKGKWYFPWTQSLFFMCFLFLFAASHIVSSYFGFETCVRCGNDR